MALPDEEDLSVKMHKKTALLEYLHLIDFFSGDQGSITLQQFLVSFNRISNHLEWEEKDKIFALESKVTGSAATLVSRGVKEKKTFKQLIDNLKERYVVADSPAMALQKFLNFKQTPGMKVRDFFDRASELVAAAVTVEGCDPGVIKASQKAMLKSMLLTNLAPEIRKSVVAKDPESPDDILKFALLEEKAWDSVRVAPSYQFDCKPSTSENQSVLNTACAINNVKKEYEHKQANEIEDLKQKIDLLTAQVASLVTANSQNHNSTNVSNNKPNFSNNRSKKDIICFKCEKAGHYANECRNFMQDNENRGNNSNNRNFNRDREYHNNNRRTNNHREGFNGRGSNRSYRDEDDRYEQRQSNQGRNYGRYDHDHKNKNSKN